MCKGAGIRIGETFDNTTCLNGAESAQELPQICCWSRAPRWLCASEVSL